MDEIKTDAMQDCTETQEVANEQTDAVAEDAQPAQEPQGKKKVKLPKGLQSASKSQLMVLQIFRKHPYLYQIQECYFLLRIKFLRILIPSKQML